MAAGTRAMVTHGTPLPERVLERIRANGVALKGRILGGPGSGIVNPNVALRRELVRHVDECGDCRLAAERHMAGEPWPGWLFYASVEFAPQNATALAPSSRSARYRIGGIPTPPATRSAVEPLRGNEK